MRLNFQTFNTWSIPVVSICVCLYESKLFFFFLEIVDRFLCVAGLASEQNQKSGYTEL